MIFCPAILIFFVCAYAHICGCTYVYMWVCVCVGTYMCIRGCVFVYVHMCICGCLFLCVYVWVYVRVCAHLKVRDQSQEPLPLFAEVWPLNGLELTYAARPQGSTHLCLPSVVITSLGHHTQLFCMNLGINLRSSGLHKRFTDWTISVGHFNVLSMTW